jgi:hypothetical protein
MCGYFAGAGGHIVNTTLVDHPTDGAHNVPRVVLKAPICECVEKRVVELQT